MITFISILGIFRNSNDFNLNRIEDENEKRLWRTSYIDPMNSNIAFILYKSNKEQGKYRLRVFHNEKLVKTDGCKSTDCDLDDFVEYFQNMKRACGTTRDVCRWTIP